MFASLDLTLLLNIFYLPRQNGWPLELGQSRQLKKIELETDL